MSSNSSSSDDLRMQARSHEVALAELNSLSSSRVFDNLLHGSFIIVWNVVKKVVVAFGVLYWAVYQRNGNIFFRTTIQKAAAFEQKQLDAAKSKLQKLS